MVCFGGSEFPVPSLQPILSNFVVCTARQVTCDTECQVTLALGVATLLLALYDAYNVSRYLKHFVAPRRHLVVMLLALGAYALLNSMHKVFSEESLMWGGISAFLRIYFVYHYMMHMMSVVFIESFGDYEELIELTGNLLESLPQKKNEAWVRTCFFKVHLWMFETVVSFIVKRVCDTYLILFKFEGKRVSLWEGAFIYILFVDIAFTMACASGISQITAVMEPLLAPTSKYIVKRRHQLFHIFYLGISLLYPSLIQLVFLANVGVDDETYTWWGKHNPIIIAAHLLPFQIAVHRYWVPMYKWSFSTSEMAELGKAVSSHGGIHAHLHKLADQGIYLSTVHQDRIAQSKKLREAYGTSAESTARDKGDDSGLHTNSV